MSEINLQRLVEAMEAPPIGTGTLSLADITALMDEMFSRATADPLFTLSPKRMHALQRAAAKGKRYVRWQKIRKRQRRAQQRRHNRGEK